MSGSLNEHESKSKGVHGISNVNDLLNANDFFGRWQATAGATAGQTVGMSAPTITGTPANADDAVSTWIAYPTSTTINTDAGLASAFTLYRATWMPTYTCRLKLGSDISSQRLWFGFTSAAPGGSDTAPAHSAMFRYSTAAGDANWKVVTKDATTQNTVDSGVIVRADQSIILSIQAEGILGQAPLAWNFFVNNALISRVTANLPVSATTNLGWVAGIRTLVGASRTVRPGLVSVGFQG